MLVSFPVCFSHKLLFSSGVVGGFGQKKRDPWKEWGRYSTPRTCTVFSALCFLWFYLPMHRMQPS